MLDYESILYRFRLEDGVLVWNLLSGNSREEKIFNTKFANKPAGSLHKSSGYIRVNVDHQDYLAHIIVFMLYYGYRPEMVDHKDCNKLNIHPLNLRAADSTTNTHNASKSSRNTSGFKGVSYHKASGQWQGRIMFKGKSYSAGLHSTPEAANEALIQLRKKLHGEYARNT